jgi:hypothetical protein
MVKACFGVFPQICVNKAEVDKMQSGFTLTNLYNWELKVPVTAVVLDFQGRIRWFFQHGDVPDVRGDIDVRSDSEGVLIGGTNIVEREDAVFPVLINWDQYVLWKGKFVNHHHIHRRKNGNFMFLTFETRIMKEHEGVVGADIIVEFDPRRNVIVWLWRLLDHVVPEKPKHLLFDWSHCNTIEEDSEGRFLYLSARNLNSIFKINRKTGEIVWRLGEKGDFKIKGEDMFYNQHSPELQKNGNLLIFDNGTGRPAKYGGRYSRAVELEIDEDKMKAKAVWSWGEDLEIYTPIWGDADKLDNGNILMTFGTRTHPKTSRLVEVTLKNEIVWDVELKPSGWGMYRAERLSIAGRKIPVRLFSP